MDKKNALIFEMLARVQAALGESPIRGFRAYVGWSEYDGALRLWIEHPNPWGPFALLDAVGGVFGEADRADGCESCGHDSAVTVALDVVAAVSE